MSTWLRRAGRGRDHAGAWVTWTVATGRRGRRWREVRVAPDGNVVSSLLLETDPDRRFAHLELSTAAGLMTLHPEGDGTVHGNVVAEHGVRHVRGLRWSPDDLILLEGSSIALAAAAHLLEPGVGLGDEVSASGLAIELGLQVAPAGPIRVRRVGVGSWQFASGAAVAIEAGGLPVLDAGFGWPLETE